MCFFNVHFSAETHWHWLLFKHMKPVSFEELLSVTTAQSSSCSTSNFSFHGVHIHSGCSLKPTCNTVIKTVPEEDKIRDIEGAIPQSQSRISELCYLAVISLYLSLSYLPKCAAPYLPTILLCSASSLSRVGSFSWSVCFSFVRLFKGL